MKKRAYFNTKTKELAYFNRSEALRLNKRTWEMVPDMENFINTEGKHCMRLHFKDFTVDIVETDESMEANAPNNSIISDVEVVENGNRSTN